MGAPAGTKAKVGGDGGASAGDRSPRPPVRSGADSRRWLASAPLVVRGWTAGERIRPLGGTGRRLLVRCFQDARVPRSRRARRGRCSPAPTVRCGSRASAAPTPSFRNRERRLCASMLSTPEVLRRTGGKPVKSIVYDESTIAARVAGARGRDHRGVSGRRAARPRPAQGELHLPERPGARRSSGRSRSISWSPAPTATARSRAGPSGSSTIPRPGSRGNISCWSRILLIQGRPCSA